MEQVLQIERELNEIRSKQAAAEEQHRTIFRRLDQQDKLIESVNNLATSNQLLAAEQKRQGRRIDGLCEDMEEIKGKPAKRWEGITEKVLLTIAGALVSYALAKMGII
jgi:hypothetical protein